MRKRGLSAITLVALLVRIRPHEDQGLLTHELVNRLAKLVSEFGLKVLKLLGAIALELVEVQVDRSLGELLVQIHDPAFTDQQ
jgi:hypothetical protein